MPATEGTTGDTDDVVSIEIDPAHAVVEVDNGVVAAPLHYAATGVTESGERIALTGLWSFDRPDLATITGGDLLATALAGGTEPWPCVPSCDLFEIYDATCTGEEWSCGDGMLAADC